MESLIDKNIEIELQNMECPFTWEMDDLKKNINTDYHDHDEEESLPLLKLMRNNMALYVDSKANEDFKIIQKTLEKTKKNLAELKTEADPEISFEAASYVTKATEGFVYLNFGMKNELKKLLKELNDSNWDKEDKKFKSTLIGCESLAWSIYHQHGARKAEEIVRKAIKINPDCHLWHFILGKNLRRIRRDSSFGSRPNQEEIASFKKIYELSKNPVYGIFVAQSYRENQDYYNAQKIYEKIVESNPKSTTILLRSALGLIRLRKLDLAKACLDKVGKENSSGSMYSHYMGIYYMKTKQHNKAIKYLKAAMQDHNLPAEKDYVRCMLKTNTNFDLITYLLQMVEKYRKIFPEKQTQSIVLDVAFLQWKKKNRYDLAVEYFLKSIEIDPKAGCLTNYFCDLGPVIPCRNVYKTINNDFLPLAKEKLKLDKNSMKAIENLQKYCNNYFDQNAQNLEKEFSKLYLKN